MGLSGREEVVSLFTEGCRPAAHPCVGKYLRIILLEDGETVHNAFLDRKFREEVP